MIWVLLGSLGNYVASDFVLSPAQKGLMTAVPLLGGSILRLVFGHLTDTIGAKKTGRLGLVVTLIPLLAGWLWLDSIPKIYAVGLLLGVAGASFAAALPLASRWYPPEFQGLAMGIAGAGNSGTLFATLFAPRLAEAYGWHAVFGLAILPLVAVTVIFCAFAKEAPQSGARSRGSEFLPVLRETDTYYFSLFYGVTFGGFVGLASFLSIYLRDQYGISRVQAGDLASLCVIAGSFLRPMGGMLADRLGGIRILKLLYGLVALLLLLQATRPTLAPAVALFVVTMAALGLGNGSVFQLVPQRFGRRVGVATGILGAAGGLGGFFLPMILGYLKQVTGAYSSGLVVLAAVAGIALVTLFRVQRGWVGSWTAEHGRVRSPTGGSSAAPALVGVAAEGA